MLGKRVDRGERGGRGERGKGEEGRGRKGRGREGRGGKRSRGGSEPVEMTVGRGLAWQA